MGLYIGAGTSREEGTELRRELLGVLAAVVAVGFGAVKVLVEQLRVWLLLRRLLVAHTRLGGETSIQFERQNHGVAVRVLALRGLQRALSRLRRRLEILLFLVLLLLMVSSLAAIPLAFHVFLENAFH